MTWKAKLDKSGAYSKQKAELNLQLSAATCSVACWKFIAFVYQISELTERSTSVSVKEYVLTELERK